MNLVTDADQLIKRIGQVPRSHPGYTTSFFASPAKIHAWVKTKSLSTLEFDDSVFILRRDDGFSRVHHVAVDPPSLSVALSILVDHKAKHTLVVDLIGKGDLLDTVADVYRSHGFTARARLIRMHLIAQYIGVQDSAGEADPATVEDVPRLRDFMERWLDPLAEQIQTKAELAQSVASGHVLVVRQDSHLAGILIYETIGFSTTLRYWHVDGRYRNRGIGANLMRAFLSRCVTSKRIVLWVFADNSEAIDKYRHYGFREENLMDEIMVRQPETTAK